MLGIVGSPRRGGNTEILVDEVLRGAEGAGATVEKVALTDLDISPCRACEACLETGKCVQQDDMTMVLEKMRNSQVWVLGTPVYWCGPSAQFKAFLDRWFGKGEVVGFKGKRAVVTIPLGASDEGVARPLVEMFEGALSHAEIEIVATVLAPDVWDRGKVREHPEILSVAYQAGAKAVASDRE